MRISKMLYKRNYLLNPVTLEHEHIGVEVDINEGESPDEALHMAKVFVEKFGNYIPETKLEKIEPDFTEEMTILESYHYREDAMNYLKLKGYTYFKELTNIANQKPTRNL